MTDGAATSPELTGGAGFTFEDRCSALYLAALLAEATAAGLIGDIVACVELQRGSFGAPMDDIIVTGRSLDGSSRTLSLQVKRELTVSAAPSNGDFRDIVAKGIATIRSKHFRSDRDRIGAVTGAITQQAKRALETVCEWARSSLDLNSFQARFATGVASEEHRRVRNSVYKALVAANPAATDSDLYVFLRHFVLVTVNLLHEGSTDEANAVGLLSRCLSPPQSAQAHELWQTLTLLACDGAGRAAQFDRASLLGKVRGRFRFLAAPSVQEDLMRLKEESAAALAEIANEVDGVHSPRPKIVAEVRRAVAESRFVQIAGQPGVGKSAVMREVAASYDDNAAILFLKADRVHGTGWLSHCTELGLARAPLKSILVEIAASGTAIVFIDGLDRVEARNRGVINDILNLLATDTDLADWRVLATVPDNGLEPLRNWLSPKWLQAAPPSSRSNHSPTRRRLLLRLRGPVSRDCFSAIRDFRS